MKFVFAMLLSLAMGLVGAIFTFLPFYLAWNYGFVAAVSTAKHISLGQAFLFDFCIVLFGNALKGTSVQMKADQ